jgi:hypothetical protein
MEFYVEVTHDPGSHVWITEHSDIPGLSMYDANRDKLINRFHAVVPYLIRINEVNTGSDTAVDLTVCIRDHGEVREHPIQINLFTNGKAFTGIAQS